MRTLLFIILTIVGCNESSDNPTPSEFPVNLEKIWSTCELMDSSLTSLQIEKYHNKKWGNLDKVQLKFIGKVDDVESFMSGYWVWLINPSDTETITKRIIVTIKSKEIATSLRRNDIVLVKGIFIKGSDNCKRFGFVSVKATSIKLYEQKENHADREKMEMH